MTPRQTRRWAGLLFGLAALLILLSGRQGQLNALTLPAVGCLLACAWLVFRRWRCPHRGRRLPAKHLFTLRCCPHCGHSIDEA